MLPLQDDPDQLEPDQLEPLQVEPDQVEPLQDEPLQVEPFHTPPDQLDLAASSAAIVVELNAFPKMSRSPVSATPFDAVR